MTTLSRCENLLLGMARSIQGLLDAIDKHNSLDTDDVVQEAYKQGEHMLVLYNNYIDEDED